MWHQCYLTSNIEYFFTYYYSVNKFSVTFCIWRLFCNFLTCEVMCKYPFFILVPGNWIEPNKNSTGKSSFFNCYFFIIHEIEFRNFKIFMKFDVKSPRKSSQHKIQHWFICFFVLISYFNYNYLTTSTTTLYFFCSTTFNHSETFQSHFSHSWWFLEIRIKIIKLYKIIIIKKS